MCGIVGYVGYRNAAGVVLDALRRLEYRGYDSAGIAYPDGNRILVTKNPGRVAQLAQLLAPVAGAPDGPRCGLGHTRWATHGSVTRQNAHPHLGCAADVAVVHNGIIENHEELRRALRAAGHRFRSETDSEVIAHLLEGASPGGRAAAIARILRRLRGSFAFAAFFQDDPSRLWAARFQSPLVVGRLDGEALLASDIPAILPFTRRLRILEDMEFAELSPGGVRVFGPDGRPHPLRFQTVTWTQIQAEKGGFPHFMLKEIHEQPEVVAREIQDRFDPRGFPRIHEAPVSAAWLRGIRRAVITACGTAYHAGLYTKYAVEDFAGLPAEVVLASELRYSETPLDRHTLVLAISQSGETADTLAALRRAREAGARTYAICNVRGSSLEREADLCLRTRAGVEVGVAATKTYVSQLCAGALWAMALGRATGHLPVRRASALRHAFGELPRLVADVLRGEAHIAQIARRYLRRYDFMYIGRRYNLPTAYEGALKMKEITYRHAEGYGAGEMKHGPLALVDPNLVTVAIVLRDRVRDKMISNVEEIRARRGRVVAVVTRGDRLPPGLCDHRIPISPVCEELSPIPAVVPLQLLAYHAAAALGRDVDRPRNLAKSVTVE
jgi:glucosamine--fructose-6-phosphate aminotransferase (isomerizing)